MTVSICQTAHISSRVQAGWRGDLSLPLRSFPTPPSLRAGISVATSQIWSSNLIAFRGVEAPASLSSGAV